VPDDGCEGTERPEGVLGGETDMGALDRGIQDEAVAAETDLDAEAPSYAPEEELEEERDREGKKDGGHADDEGGIQGEAEEEQSDVQDGHGCDGAGEDAHVLRAGGGRHGAFLS
jgi:hypothetical protein